jgi:hypothetical protein
MEGLEQAIKNAQKEKPMDVIAREYDVSMKTIYSVLNGNEPKQIRIREALNRIIKDFGEK